MKKFLLLITGIFLLSGCVMETEEVSTLKIKVLNLEASLKEQDKRLVEMEKKVSHMEKRLSEEMATKFLEAQSKVLSDLNDLRKDLTLLQSKLEEMQFQKEAQSDLQRKALEDINTKIAALELKLKDLETQFKSSNQTLLEGGVKGLSNQTSSNGTPSNQTLSREGLSNQTLSNQTQTLSKPVEIPLKEADLYQKAFSLLEKGDLKGAKTLFTKYLKDYPQGKWVPQTHFYLGEIYFKEKDYESAILEYQKLIETPGPNALKPRAMLRQAEAFLALKDKKAAEILLKKIIKTYPGTKEAKEAQEQLKKLKL